MSNNDFLPEKGEIGTITAELERAERNEEIAEGSKSAIEVAVAEVKVEVEGKLCEELPLSDDEQDRLREELKDHAVKQEFEERGLDAFEQEERMEESSELLQFSSEYGWIRLEDGGILSLSHVLRFEQCVRRGLLAHVLSDPDSPYIVVSGSRDYIRWYADKLYEVFNGFELGDDYISPEEFLSG